jgi:hypothetical protein
MDHTLVAFIADVREGQLDDLRKTLATVEPDVLRLLGGVSTLHCAAFVVFDGAITQGRFPSCLAFEASVDGSLDDFLIELTARPEGEESNLAVYLRQVYHHCSGFDAGDERLRDYLRDRAHQPHLWSVGNADQRARQVVGEQRVRAAIEPVLDASVAHTGPWSTARPASGTPPPPGVAPPSPTTSKRALRLKAQIAVQAPPSPQTWWVPFARADGGFEWGAVTSSSALRRLWYLVRFLLLVLAAIFVLASPVLALFVPRIRADVLGLLLAAHPALRVLIIAGWAAAWLAAEVFLVEMLITRKGFVRSLVHLLPHGNQHLPGFLAAHVDELLEQEDRHLQNHLSSLVELKSGRLRRYWVRALLWTFNVMYRSGLSIPQLAALRTIHFAQWTLIDGGRRLLFLSNYDGTWNQYLDDFIELLDSGVEKIWDMSIDYPGTTTPGGFKQWARTKQTTHAIWYVRYPDLSVPAIDNNTAIRQGLFGRPNTRAIDDWLRRFGSVSPR